LSNNPLVILCA